MCVCVPLSCRYYVCLCSLSQVIARTRVPCVRPLRARSHYEVSQIDGDVRCWLCCRVHAAGVARVHCLCSLVMVAQLYTQAPRILTSSSLGRARCQQTASARESGIVYKHHVCVFTVWSGLPRTLSYRYFTSSPTQDQSARTPGTLC